ncbi:MAG: hypothetical protein FWD26_08085 [Treponema sp.]|nr:hypothetical protein [Treponema sp.]
MKKTLVFTILLVTAGLLFVTGCTGNKVPLKGKFILSAAVSIQDTGLLDYLLPVFTQEKGWEADVITVDPAAALQMGRDGDADVLLVHVKQNEIQFVNDGYGIARYDIMYSNFSAVDPNQDTAVNYYGIILVNPMLHPHTNVEGGLAFIEWLLSGRAQDLIGQYGEEEFGSALFTPNASLLD